ncbi:MAG: polyprenol monophosphomannose synthase [Planctomycetaceae bacterium]|nr:polyprenol monophosphomannose synthase [Planctomycetaceae bacterium]
MSERADPCVSVVLPTYKEAENLTTLVDRIAATLVACNVTYEIIVVDDDSDDGTEAIMQRLAQRGAPISLILRRGVRDLSTAVVSGFSQATGQVLVCMDADLSHPPEALRDIVRAMTTSHADCCIASRYTKGGSAGEGWAWHRYLNSWAGIAAARIWTSVSDPMSGYFAVTRSALDSARPLNPIGFKILLELLVKCPLKNIHEVPILFAPRASGRSKLNLRQKWNFLRHLFRLVCFTLGSSPRG